MNRLLIITLLMAGALGAAADTVHAAARQRALIVTATEGKRLPLAKVAERRLVAAAKAEGLKPVVVRSRSKLTPKAIRRAAAVAFAGGTGTVLSGPAERALNQRVR